MTTEHPYYRLTTLETACFLSRGLIGYQTRLEFARRLCHAFPKGVYVVAVTLEVRAFVNPVGVIEILMPPLHRVERWQCVNNDAVGECVCRGFFDPEVKGPWKHRNESRHHPLCQVGRLSKDNWGELQGSAVILAPGMRWKDVHVEQNPEEPRP